MHYIAHRANTDGEDPLNENSPEKIKATLALGFDVEADVWYRSGIFMLGHDKPLYEVPEELLKEERIWWHAKDVDALHKLLELNLHCFYHRTDNATLTSRGYIWVYPQKPMTSKSICVMPEWDETNAVIPGWVAGICSDFIARYRVES